jgi:hypothetical protein
MLAIVYVMRVPDLPGLCGEVPGRLTGVRSQGLPLKTRAGGLRAGRPGGCDRDRFVGSGKASRKRVGSFWLRFLRFSCDRRHNDRSAYKLEVTNYEEVPM